MRPDANPWFAIESLERGCVPLSFALLKNDISCEKLSTSRMISRSIKTRTNKTQKKCEHELCGGKRRATRFLKEWCATGGLHDQSFLKRCARMSDEEASAIESGELDGEARPVEAGDAEGDASD